MQYRAKKASTHKHQVLPFYFPSTSFCFGLFQLSIEADIYTEGNTQTQDSMFLWFEISLMN